jgi:hypothetical protein
MCTCAPIPHWLRSWSVALVDLREASLNPIKHCHPMKLPNEKRGQVDLFPPAALESLLTETVAATSDAPPSGFLDRCRTVGRQAAQIQSLRAARPLAAASLSPLREHFRQLATFAQVQLDDLLTSLAPLKRGGGGLVAWVRLGQALGMPAGEMRQRVRLEFVPRRLLAAMRLHPSPSFGRSRPGPDTLPPALENNLAKQEAAYSPRRGQDLARALATVDVVYGHNRN